MSSMRSMLILQTAKSDGLLGRPMPSVFQGCEPVGILETNKQWPLQFKASLPLPLPPSATWQLCTPSQTVIRPRGLCPPEVPSLPSIAKVLAGKGDCCRGSARPSPWRMELAAQSYRLHSCALQYLYESIPDSFPTSSSRPWSFVQTVVNYRHRGYMRKVIAKGIWLVFRLTVVIHSFVAVNM